MRNKSRIFLLLIGAGLIFSPAVLADTEGEATAVLFLKAVIHITVTDNWDNLTIVQKDASGLQSAIKDWGPGAIIDWDPGQEDIVVNVKAITNFIVRGTYYASVDPEELGDANNLIGLAEGASIHWLRYKEFIDLFKGENNIKVGGDTKIYEVKLKPENLGDRAAGEEIKFTVMFVVEDPTT